MGAAVGEAIGASDALLLGRRGYEEFAAYWPQQDPGVEPFVSIMNDTPKFVASTTLENVDDWQNSTLLEGDLTDAVNELKAQPGKNIGMSGSATLVRSLLERASSTSCGCSCTRSSSVRARSCSPTARRPCRSSSSRRRRSRPASST